MAWSYGDLVRHALSIAAAMPAPGRDELVAIALDKSPTQIAAVLGVVIAGGAYPPLDPGLPEAPFRRLLERSAARVVVTTAALAARLPLPEGVAVVRADQVEAADALQGRSVDPGTSFFELGADSLTAVAVNRRLRADLGLESCVTDLFEHPNLRLLARHFAGAADRATTPQPYQPAAPSPATPLDRRAALRVAPPGRIDSLKTTPYTVGKSEKTLEKNIA